ncbi:MAG: ABC transporter substrate-binding protein [Methanoregula sp.]|nr:ABC transporter substrate-binding protein [Methanoregula sp.]
MIIIDKNKLWLIPLILILILAAGWAGYTIYHASTPVRIGVLLPMTGDIELNEPLEWAKENLNRQGGIGGRQIELVYKDTSQGDTTSLARELLADDSVRIVIGPPTSDDVYLLAPEFIKKEKLLISPLTTSGDIIRAFGKNGYFWRTAQGDVGQVKAILSVLNDKKVQRIAVLCENSSYGETFYDWTGFFATEYGIGITSIHQFEPGSSTLEADVQEALAEDPEYILAACGDTDAAVIKRLIDRSKKPVKLFLTDAGGVPALISSLGAAAEGIEGTSPTADPGTGFAVAYDEKFGHPPTDYAASAYDALLLATYATARQDASFLESPADSMRKVVYGNGTPKGWDAQESYEALVAIRSGQTPAIAGASGPLDYDTEFGVDPLVTYYSYWVVEEGTFHTTEVLGSAKAGSSGTSSARTHASTSLMALSGTSAAQYQPPENRTGFMAVVVGPSRGWNNYRHQSDALAVYTLLRKNGVPDDNIILMLYDDIPTDPQNPIRGDIHNIPKGSNLRSGAGVDYTGRQVSARTLKNVLTGNRTEETPFVLDSDQGTDVFVYIASHGQQGGIVFYGKQEPFTTDDFTELTATMEREGRYRQIVYMVDTCFGESIAKDATAKGMLYFTGAASSEPSLGAVYDMDIRQWLSDEFTAGALNAIRANPDITFRDLYTVTYEKVTGSHVRMLNNENFGSIDVPVQEFLQP